MEEILKYIKDPAMVVGIIGLTEVVKTFLKVKNRKFLVLIPLILGLAAGAVSAFGNVGTMIYEGLKYAGFASLAYQFYSKFFTGKEKNGTIKTN